MKLIPLAIICTIGIASFSVLFGTPTIKIIAIATIMTIFFILRIRAFGNISISEWREKHSHPTTKIQNFIHLIYPADMIILSGTILMLITP